MILMTWKLYQMMRREILLSAGSDSNEDLYCFQIRQDLFSIGFDKHLVMSADFAYFLSQNQQMTARQV